MSTQLMKMNVLSVCATVINRNHFRFAQCVRVGPVALMLGVVLAGLSGCQKAAAPPQAPPPPLVTVSAPIMYSVHYSNEYNGYLNAVETVEIRARVKGFLTDVLFNEGDEVKAGDRLYTIDPREYAAMVAKSKSDIAKAEADIANGKAQIALSEAELNRLKNAGAATSKNEVDKATATVAANRASLDVSIANKAAAEAGLQSAQLQLGYCDIRAPISGRISRTLVTRGNLVGQGDATLLTTIVSLDPMYVYFDIPERDFVAYQRAQMVSRQGKGEAKAEVVEVGIATEEGFPHSGVIDFLENRVDTGTGTVRLRGRLSNPTAGSTRVRKLYPGLYAKVRVPTGGEQKKLVVPEDALMTGQEGRFMYVLGKDNVVIKRSVVVGPQVWRIPTSEDKVPTWILKNPNPAPPAEGKPSPPSEMIVRSAVAIEKGLEPGDRVIVNGLQKARPGAPVTPSVWDMIPLPSPNK